MRRMTVVVLATAAMIAATPTYAGSGGNNTKGGNGNTTATPTTDPCSAIFVQGAIACQGYYGKNLIKGGVGSTLTADEKNYLYLLLNGTALTTDSKPTSNTASYDPPYTADYSKVLASLSNLNGSATLTFTGVTLSGYSILGAHFGNNIDSDPNNVTAFWLVATPTNTITLSSGNGSSDAEIFATGIRQPAVPEPATWALMLLGLGAIGFALRRFRATPPASARFG